MKIDEYFDSIERTLRTHPTVSRIDEPIFSAASDDYNGVLHVRVVFWDHSYLDIHETVNTELGYPVRIHYAYTFIQNGVHIFRYDNAPHHRNILTFPHHKHVDSDERPIPSDQPTLNQVIIEIDALLKK